MLINNILLLKFEKRRNLTMNFLKDFLGVSMIFLMGFIALVLI
jgi:hypothetical protein|tara:strand:- start:3969 stop:4097 length:129 start_codon:yes stop_codon:yes gene_type:complete